MTTSLTSSPFDPVHHAACHHPSPPPPHHHRQHQHDLHPRPASSALSPHVKRFRTSTTSPTKPNTTEPIAADTFHDDDDTDDYDDDDTNDDDDDDDDEDDALSCQFKFSAGVGNQTHDSSQEFHDHCFTQSGDRYSLMKLELERLMKHHEEHFKFRHKYSELLGQFEREQRRADERERLFDNAVIDNDDDDEDDDDSDYDFDDDSDFDDCDVDDDSDEGEGDHGDHPSLRYEGGSAAGTGMDNTSAMDVSPPESALTTRSSSPTLWSTIYSKATVSEWASSGSASSKCAPGPRRVSAAAQLGVRRSKPIPIPYSSSAGSCKMSCGKVSAAAHEAGTCHSYQLTPHSAAHRVGGL